MMVRFLLLMFTNTCALAVSSQNLKLFPLLEKSLVIRSASTNRLKHGTSCHANKVMSFTQLHTSLLPES